MGWSLRLRCITTYTVVLAYPCRHTERGTGHPPARVVVTGLVPRVVIRVEEGVIVLKVVGEDTDRILGNEVQVLPEERLPTISVEPFDLIPQLLLTALREMSANLRDLRGLKMYRPWRKTNQKVIR